MAAKNPSSSQTLQSLVTVLRRYRAVHGGLGWSHQVYHRELPPHAVECSGYQGLRWLSESSWQYRQPKLGMENAQSEDVRVQPSTLPPPPPPSYGSSSWVKWLLGSLLTLLLPLWNNILKLEGMSVKVVEEVEAVAEVVEKVAETADKALAEAAKQLPDKSKLKEAVQAMEHASHVVAQDAQLVEDIIHKVGDLKQNLEDLDAMVEPIVEKLTKGEHT